MLWMTLKYCTKQICHYQHTLITIHATTIYWIWVISSVFRCFNKVRRKAISSLAFWKISVWSSEGQRRKLGAHTIEMFSKPILVLSTTSGGMKFCQGGLGREQGEQTTHRQ